MQERVRSLVATSLAHFVNDGNGYIFITLYPILFPLAFYSYGSSKFSALFIIGILVALENAFSVIASPLVGKAADKTKRYGMLLSLGLILMGIGIVGYALTTLFTSGIGLFFLLIPFSIVAGIGSAFYHPLGGTVLSETWPTQYIGRAMGINGSSGSTGRAIYPLLVVALVAYLTIPSVIVLAVLSLIIGLLVLVMIRKVNFLQTKQIPNDTKASKSRSFPLKSIIRPILALTIVSFMKGLFSLGIISFVPEYLEHVSGMSYGLELGLTLSLVLALPVMGQPVFGSIADRFGRRLSLGITTLGSGAAILILLYTHNLFVQIASLAVFGFFTFTQFPLLMPLATNAVPKEVATLSNSIVWGLGNAGGGALGPFLIGLLATPSILGSLNGAFLVVTIISLSSLVLLPFVSTKRFE
jgi:MFS transporter, FSR family, fosmidomycin resistance protein